LERLKAKFPKGKQQSILARYLSRKDILHYQHFTENTETVVNSIEYFYSVLNTSLPEH